MMDLSRARKIEMTSNSLLLNDESEHTIQPMNNMASHLKKKKSLVRGDSKGNQISKQSLIQRQSSKFKRRPKDKLLKPKG